MASRKTDLEPTVVVASKRRKLLTNWENVYSAKVTLLDFNQQASKGLNGQKQLFRHGVVLGKKIHYYNVCNWTLKSSKPTHQSGTKRAMHHLQARKTLTW